MGKKLVSSDSDIWLHAWKNDSDICLPLLGDIGTEKDATWGHGHCLGRPPQL